MRTFILPRSSSRSHGIFTIKIVRNLDGCEARDVKAASVSTFSVVDLAGSERISNTGTTGDRLREAGNINKSLMVLGQCMEVLRRNQECKERNKKVRSFLFLTCHNRVQLLTFQYRPNLAGCCPLQAQQAHGTLPELFHW